MAEYENMNDDVKKQWHVRASATSVSRWYLLALAAAEDGRVPADQPVHHLMKPSYYQDLLQSCGLLKLEDRHRKQLSRMKFLTQEGFLALESLAHQAGSGPNGDDGLCEQENECSSEEDDKDSDEIERSELTTDDVAHNEDDRGLERAMAAMETGASIFYGSDAADDDDRSDSQSGQSGQTDVDSHSDSDSTSRSKSENSESDSSTTLISTSSNSSS